MTSIVKCKAVYYYYYYCYYYYCKGTPNRLFHERMYH
jgi:hypothetical protein